MGFCLLESTIVLFGVVKKSELVDGMGKSEGKVLADEEVV
jgi:hypothetical protein